MIEKKGLKSLFLARAVSIMRHASTQPTVWLFQKVDSNFYPNSLKQAVSKAGIVRMALSIHLLSTWSVLPL